MANRCPLKSGGDTVLPVDIVDVARDLDYVGNRSLSLLLDRAVAVLHEEGYAPTLKAQLDAFDACVTIARLMGYGMVPSTAVRKVVSLAADILPTK